MLLVVVTIVATALRSGSSTNSPAAIASVVPSSQLAPNAPPAPLGMATAPGNLVLDVPINHRRVTAIVYHGVGTQNLVP